jgi:Rad9
MTVPIQIHKATSSWYDVKCRLEYYHLPADFPENSYYSVFSRREILRRGRIKILVQKRVKLKSLKIFNLEHVDSSFDFSVNMVLLPYPPALMYLSVLIVGVIKTHQLTYSPTQTLYAISNRDECTQHFTIHSRLAKDYLEYFQSRIEEVDLYVDGDKLIFNGFTEGFTGEDNRIPPPPQSCRDIDIRVIEAAVADPGQSLDGGAGRFPIPGEDSYSSSSARFKGIYNSKGIGGLI